MAYTGPIQSEIPLVDYSQTSQHNENEYEPIPADRYLVNPSALSSYSNVTKPTQANYHGLDTNRYEHSLHVVTESTTMTKTIYDNITSTNYQSNDPLMIDHDPMLDQDITTSIFSCFSPNKFLLNSVETCPKTNKRKQKYQYMNQNTIDRKTEVLNNIIKSVFFSPFVIGAVYVRLPKLYGAASGKTKTIIIYVYFLMISVIYLLGIYVVYYLCFYDEREFRSDSELVVFDYEITESDIQSFKNAEASHNNNQNIHEILSSFITKFILIISILIIGFHIRVREMVYQARRRTNDGCLDLVYASCFPCCSAIQLKKEMELDLHERKLKVLMRTFSTNRSYGQTERKQKVYDV